MMSVSQVDMVVWADTDRVLQVCGDLSPMAGEGATPSSTDLQSFTVVVRQGDNVATLHAKAPFNDETDDETFKFDKNGRWELSRTLRPGEGFNYQQPAVVSAVIILKRDMAGLETLSWIQPVEIYGRRTSEPKPLEFDPDPEVLAKFSGTPLKMQHSASSSLVIQPKPAGGATSSGMQRIDKVHQPTPTRHRRSGPGGAGLSRVGR